MMLSALTASVSGIVPFAPFTCRIIKVGSALPTHRFQPLDQPRMIHYFVLSNCSEACLRSSLSLGSLTRLALAFYLF